MTPEEQRRKEAALCGGALEGRLAALRALCAGLDPLPRLGTNLHIHTNESFSVFRSPTEAVWQAAREHLAVFGINDHYTVAGHEEFGRACAVARIPATFSMEAVAMDRDAEAKGERTNDPANPGRTYLCAKGVTRVPPDDAPALRPLRMMRAALERRNREMTGRVRELFRERMGEDGPTWEDVVGLTPRGNTTERHISKAVAARLRGLAEAHGTALAELVERCCRATPPADDDVTVQDFIRAKLLKAGGPCYVAEASDAFLCLEDMRDLFLAFGAIPTCPLLGDPVTEGEKDIPALFDQREAMGFFATEVFPARNPRGRVAAILAAARERHWPVFSGTEHNTPAPAPLLAPLSLDPEFLPWLDASAAVLLGHQRLVEQGEPGFVRDDGTPSVADPVARFERCYKAGWAVWQEVEASR